MQTLPQQHTNTQTHTHTQTTQKHKQHTPERADHDRRRGAAVLVQLDTPPVAVRVFSHLGHEEIVDGGGHVEYVARVGAAREQPRLERVDVTFLFLFFVKGVFVCEWVRRCAAATRIVSAQRPRRPPDTTPTPNNAAPLQRALHGLGRGGARGVVHHEGQARDARDGHRVVGLDVVVLVREEVAAFWGVFVCCRGGFARARDTHNVHAHSTARKKGGAQSQRTNTRAPDRSPLSGSRRLTLTRCAPRLTGSPAM